MNLYERALLDNNYGKFYRVLWPNKDYTAFLKCVYPEIPGNEKVSTAILQSIGAIFGKSRSNIFWVQLNLEYWSLSEISLCFEDIGVSVLGEEPRNLYNLFSEEGLCEKT